MDGYSKWPIGFVWISKETLSGGHENYKLQIADVDKMKLAKYVWPHSPHEIESATKA